MSQMSRKEKQDFYFDSYMFFSLKTIPKKI